MSRPRLIPRVFALLVALAPLAGATGERTAQASVSIAVTWDGLLHESSAAVVATAVESRAVWENGRIYTYTRVHVDRSVAGDVATGGDVWVRTMGGVVGKIGQIVEGEAVLAPSRSSLLFLHSGPIGAFEVTARGQGQFPIVTDAAGAPPKVVRSHAVGAIVAPKTPTPATTPVRLAADVLHGRPVDDVAQDIAAAWSTAHAR
jgi:hypothetical protein